METDTESPELLDRPKDLIILPDSELLRLNLIIGIVMIAFGLLLFRLHFAFLILCPLSVIPFTKRQGVEISPTGMQFRKYQGYFGRRLGKWKNIPATSAIVVLTMTGSKNYASRWGGMREVSGIYYELFIMDANHHHRILIQVSEDAHDIATLAKRVSAALELPIEEFNPVPLR